MKTISENKNQKTMTKPILIASVSELSGLPKDKSDRAIDALIKSIQLGLKEGKDINIPKFGTFRVSHQPARTGRNPRTGEPVKIKAAKFPRFRASQILKVTIA